MKKNIEPAKPFPEGHRNGKAGGIAAKGKKRNARGNVPISTRRRTLQNPPKRSNPTQVEYFKDIVATIREPLLVLDKDLRVLSANRSFYKFFRVKAGETVGKLIYDLGNRQWDIPTLRALLETILPQKAVFNDYEVEHDFPTIGKRTLLLNARRIPGPPKEPQWILLAFKDVSERMRQQRALEASEERFRRAFETAQDGTLLIDKTGGQIVNSNQAAQELLGYSDRELLKKKLWEIGILKNQRQFKQTTLKLEEQSVGEFYHTTIQTRLGGHFPADVYLMDKAAVIQCNIRNISEHKRIIDALQANEEKYHSLVNQSPDGIFLIELSGKILTVNKAMCKELGYSEAEFLSMNIWDIIPTQYLAQHRKRLKKILEGESLEEAAEYALRGKDGKMHYVEVLSAPHYSGKDITGFQGIARDITPRKQAEEALRVSEERHRTLFERMAQGVIYEDAKGKIISANPAAERILGLSLDQMQGRTPSDPRWKAIHEDGSDFQGDTHPSMVALTKGEAVYNVTMGVYNPKKENYKWVNINAIPQFRPGEKVPYRVFTTFEDFTERKRTEEERQALLEIMQGVAATKSLNELLALIRQSLAKVIYAENFFVVFHNKNSGMFEEVFAVDQYDPPMPPSKLDKRITSYVFRTGEPLLLTQKGFEDLAKRGEVELVGTNSAAWLGAPLKTPTETIGVIAVQNYEDPGCYSERDKEFLSSVSAQVAVAIERKRAEEILEEERILLRTLIDNLPDRVYVMDAQGRKLISNLADWQASGGKTMEDVIGKADLDTYPPEMAKEFWALDKEVIDSGKAVINREEPGLDSQGNPVLVSSSKVPLRDGHGKVTGLVGIGHDITERRRAEESLQRSQQETAHVNSLLVALGQAAQSVQRALTTEEVYRAIQDQVSDLGLHATGFELEQEGKRLRIAFISYRRDLVHKAENATGLSLHTFHFQPRTDTIFHRTIFKRETIFIKDTAQAVADALPRSLRALSQPVAYLFRLGPSIFAPLNVGEETIGVLSITGTGLSEADIPAVTTFANQAAIAMQNTKLYTQAQQEITERRRAEERVQKSEEKYRGLVTEISDGIFITDETGKVTFANPALARIHGFEYPDQLMGRTFQEFIAPPMLNEVGNYFKRVVEDELLQEELTTELVKPDGTHAVVEVMANVERDGGKVVGTRGVVRDITERKQKEEEIKKQLEELQRWYTAMLGRETRILGLKLEVNELLSKTGQPPRYSSTESQDKKEK